MKKHKKLNMINNANPYYDKILHEINKCKVQIMIFEINFNDPFESDPHKSESEYKKAKAELDKYKEKYPEYFI